MLTAALPTAPVTPPFSHDVPLVVLGAILGFVLAVAANQLQARGNRKAIEKNLSRLLAHLLTDIEEACSSLVEQFEKTGIAWIDVVNRIGNDITVFDRNLEFAIIYSNLAREGVWRFFLALRSATTLLQGCNSILLTPGIEDKKREMTNTTLRETVKKFSEFKSTAASLREKVK